MRRVLLTLLLVCGLGLAAGAQESATDTQVKLPSLNLSSTIAVTDAFQSIQVATQRHGCTIQNKGAATMWVFFGPIASATKAKSVQLEPTDRTYCNMSGVTLSSQISITGTATQEFYAAVE